MVNDTKARWRRKVTATSKSTGLKTGHYSRLRSVRGDYAEVGNVVAFF